MMGRIAFDLICQKFDPILICLDKLHHSLLSVSAYVSPSLPLLASLLSGLLYQEHGLDDDTKEALVRRNDDQPEVCSMRCIIS